MKISLDWISDWVDLDGIDPDTIADRLTMTTAEIEGVETVDRTTAGVLCGEVVAVAELGGDTGNRLATVVCGEQSFETVCAAPNLRLGLKAPFAPPGVRLAGGVEVAVAEISGHTSQGVLCSPRDLGMSEHHEGVLELPASTTSGEHLVDAIPARDVLLEVDNKSLTHRPDLWGHYGFARELAAVFGKQLAPLAVTDLARYDHLPAYPISIDDLDGCPCYSCIEMHDLGSVPSPLVIQRRLHALGQRSHNLLVDLTNYIMLEIGQPTHAFDSSKLRAIRVAPMGSAGDFVTLDGQRRRMRADDLMIFNESKPVAVAGVMGGLDTEVEQGTTRLLLESANFRGSRVRRTSAHLGLRTEASQRFEKNQPPANTRTAVARFLHLTETAGLTPEVTHRFSYAGDLGDRFRELEIPPGFLDRKIGEHIPGARVTAILCSLGFTVEPRGDGLAVGIPPHRSIQDISIPDDIVEEVLRVYGYDNLTPRMPHILLEPLRVNTAVRSEHKARRVLATAHRFYEVHTYSWMDDGWLQTLGFEPGPTLEVANPTARHQARMRTSLVPNLLALVRQNRAHREHFRLFELGRTYHPDADDGREERHRLTGVSCSQSRSLSLEQHFREVKGTVEDVAAVLGCAPVGFATGRTGAAPWLVDGHWLSISAGDREAGILCALSGGLLDAVAPRAQVVLFDLDLQALAGPVQPRVTFQAPPIYPGSWHDFTIVWPAERGFASLDETVGAFAHQLILRREFLYDYRGKGLAKGEAAFTFRFWIGAHDHTLGGDEIEAFRAAFLGYLEGQGLALR